MNIAFISPYPPSKVTLNEYGYHLVKSFRDKPEVQKLFVLTNHLEDNTKYSKYATKGIELIPCWTFNSFFNFIHIAKTLKKLKDPDLENFLRSNRVF